MENLEKSWNLKIVISRPGKVLENSKGFGKVMVHFCSVIKRINIYVNIFSFNQTVVSHSYVYAEISQNVWPWTFFFKSWKGGKVMEIHWSTCVRAL